MSPKKNPQAVNVLLVEDDQESASLVTTAAEMAKVAFIFKIVPNGREALDYLFQQGIYLNAPCPDLIVLDLNLPILTGREVLLELEKDQELRALPIVLLTTTNSHEAIKYEFGLSDLCCYTKPDRFNDYIALIKRLERLYREKRLFRARPAINFTSA